MSDNTALSQVEKNLDGAELQDAVKSRIRQLEMEKLADDKAVLQRLAEFQANNPTFATDDALFVKLLAEGWNEHRKEIDSLKRQLQKSARKSEAMGTLCRSLQEKNKKLSTWRDELQENLDQGLNQVKGKIALYEEENVTIMKENTSLRDALKKAAEYDKKRTEQTKNLQQAKDFLLEKYDETDKKYTAICEEYAQKLDDLTTEHTKLKKSFIEQVGQNQELKQAVRLLEEKMKQDADTREMVNEFDEKYKGLLEESNKYIEQYKGVNEKLHKQNTSLKTQSAQIRMKSEKMKSENKDLTKKNKKLDKKVGTLSNLCRDLQSKIKDLQKRSQSGQREETIV